MSSLKQQTLEETFSKSNKKPKPNKQESPNENLNDSNSEDKKLKTVV
jgi:hypothetical protein